MNLKHLGSQVTKQRYDVMVDELQGYWANDIWDVQDCPLFTTDMKFHHYVIDMNRVGIQTLKNEFKYYFFKRITTLELSLTYVWDHCYRMYHLVQFIQQFYPNLRSIIDIPADKFRIGYRTFLNEKGVKSITANLQVYNQIYQFFTNFYDEREEVEKDIWDIRKLGVDYNKSRTNYKMNFENIPSPFRELVKRYVKTKLLSQNSITSSTAMQYMYKLPVFFKFIYNKHPDWSDFKHLTRNDIEDFLSHIQACSMGGKAKKKREPSKHWVNSMIAKVSTFLADIELFEWEEAPNKNVRFLILPSDIPKHNVHKVDRYKDRIKYIPDFVWDQVVQNIDKLPKEIIPIVLLLEASGFRITDVLCLKIDCLIQKEDGYWLVGDQRKVKDQDHRVPISEEIAKVVMSQQQLTREMSTSQNNPDGFLFPMYRGSRVGKPISSNNVANNLNKLAKECNIVDEKGQIYHFNAHAFRHRYGVNLINNGMNLLHVQKLLDHASPEMTLVYAQIHDTTLRKEWEKAKNNGAIKIDVNGRFVPSDLEQQAKENGLELEWIRHNLDSVRLDHGFCIKSPKQNCDFLNQMLEPPCIKNNCKSFHVDSSFLSYYEGQIEKMESDIKIYEQTNRTRLIELIQPKLKKYKEVRDSILQNGGIFGQPKGRREYTQEERDKVNQ